MHASRLMLRILAVSALLATATAALLPAAASPRVDVLPDLTLDEVLEIARVEAPPPGVGLLVHADFPAEDPLLLDGVEIYSLTADITPTGGVIVRHASTSQSATGLGATAECQDPTFVASAVKWRSGDMPIRWRFNRGSTPKDVKRFRAERATRRAHFIWPRTRNRCNQNGKNVFRFKYAGVTSRRIKYDHVNTIDFGSLGSGSLATNYTWYVDNRILEVDMRLNRSYPWVAGRPAPHRYVVRNVVAHELGHQLGLEDLSDPHGALTMFARIYKGENDKTTLGKGDIRGSDFVSP